jgi:cysteinyl-tRNA synthetase
MMLVIYNTLTQKKEVFQPILAGRVGLYVCGVTVYDYCHLGHARTYVSLDVIVRYLRWCGYDVNYVRNITDIDDKIIKRALEQGKACHTITTYFTQAMHEDFKVLGLLPPNHEPQATAYIPHMITLIKKMLISKHAYQASNGDIYFAVRHFQDYGHLSHHQIDELESGARVEVSDVKQDPLDFVLWKLAKPNEPSWDSPWGKGRPGWHIECSAMSMDLLGDHFDLHGGGRDLIFPHHENEIAQSCAATQSKFVNIWLHVGYLQVDKEKMSKSLGNFLTIRDALNEYTPEMLRYFIIASHYRSPLAYSSHSLQSVKPALTRLYTALRFLPKAEPVAESAFKVAFIAAMDDDFNTPVALSVLFDLAHEIQRLREKKDLVAAAAHGALLRSLGEVFGLLQSDPEVFFQAGRSVEADRITALIAARQQARQNQNWAEADRIRDELAVLNIIIEDGPNGTTWKSMK